MATKSAGMPSDTASSASPRYRRTLGTRSTSLSSRQSRIASAITVGVIALSPASSATGLTSAVAVRLRPAVARREFEPPLLSTWLARADNDPPFRLLANAGARHIRVTFEGEVDGPSLERLHRVERDRIACHLDLARSPHRDLAHGVLAALPVALDVYDHALAFGQVLPDHDVRYRLKRAEGLAAPADQTAEIAAADVERDRVGAGPHADLRPHAHVLEQSFDQVLGQLSLAVGRRGRDAHRRRCLVHHGDLDHRLLRRLDEDLHVHVAAALLQLDQRGVDRLVQCSAAAFSGLHVRSPPLPCLEARFLGFFDLFKLVPLGAGPFF